MSHSPTPDKDPDQIQNADSDKQQNMNSQVHSTLLALTDLIEQFSKLIGILKNNPILINIIVALGTGSISWAFYSSDFQNQTYQEKKINLGDVCIHETTKEAFRKEYERKVVKGETINVKDYHLATPSHKLSTNKPLVYPVFRWVCEFRKEGNPHVTNQQEPLPVGLNLDEYCQQKYKAESFKKATHRNYKDPNSLYCVNPD
jgi:hypothetical protein